MSDKYPHDNRPKAFTITPEWKLPLYVVVPIIMACVAGALAYASISSKLDSMLSRDELQVWTDNLRESNPGIIKVPPLPRHNNQAASRDPIWTALRRNEEIPPP